MDADVVVIGSGFGGSVAAMRLTEKGYRVLVVEQGRRYRPEDFAKTSWALGKALWAPRLGLRGVMGVRVLKNLVVFHGAGVGGGSLVYANVHLEPLDAFYRDPQWAHLADWREELAPHYREARRMLGSAESPRTFASDHALHAVLEDMGQGDTFKRHTVGVYFGEPDAPAEDPYFGGEGPTRRGCTFCGRCMLGCRVGAKNTLDKNYLYLAERGGAQVLSESRVVDVRPLDGGSGATGYAIKVRSTGRGPFGRSQVLRAKKVVFSAGVLGTVELLARCKGRGSLPRISDRLGDRVRTNSESIQGVNVYGEDISEGVAISSGGFTQDGTHVEIFRYGQDGDALAWLSTVHTRGGRLPRQAYWFAAMLRHPLRTLRQLWPVGWSKSLAGVLAMQANDTSMKLELRRSWWWPLGQRLVGAWGERNPPPTYLPSAHEVTARLAEKMGGIPGSVLPEVLFDTTTTAHILGGCSMGASAAEGVIDRDQRVFGYEGLYVADGSAISANLGVNPSLTITAMTERAMAQVPAAGRAA